MKFNDISREEMQELTVQILKKVQPLFNGTNLVKFTELPQDMSPVHKFVLEFNKMCTFAPMCDRLTLMMYEVEEFLPQVNATSQKNLDLFKQFLEGHFRNMANMLNRTRFVCESHTMEFKEKLDNERKIE